MARKALTDQDRERIVGLYKAWKPEDMPIDSVVELSGVSKQTFYKVLHAAKARAEIAQLTALSPQLSLQDLTLAEQMTTAVLTDRVAIGDLLSRGELLAGMSAVVALATESRVDEIRRLLET